MVIRRCLAAILCAPVLCSAATDVQRRLVLPTLGEARLPELPGGASESQWDIDISEDGAGLGFKNGKVRWEAQVGSTLDGLSSIQVEHLEQLTDRLGMGSVVSHEEGATSLLLNSVYAPSETTRIRLAAARKVDDAALKHGPSVSQHSVLIGAKKSWRQGTLSDVAIRLYGIQARQLISAFSHPENNAAYHDGDTSNIMAYSRLQGARFDMGIRPYSDGTFRFQYEFNQTSHDGINTNMNRFRANTMRVEYARALENCVHLTSQWVSTDSSNTIELTLSRQHWRMHASRTIGSESSTSLVFAFVHALDAKEASAVRCKPSASEPVFEPMLEALGNSPEQLLYDAHFPTM